MRLFAICPRIKKEAGPRIVATSAWRVRILSLGAIQRQVVIEPASQMITVRSRYLWLIRKQRTIRFSDVQAVTYGYEDLMSHQSFFSYSHDSFDWFSVGLRLADDSEIGLFNFIGEGTFSNNGPLPDWLYWGESKFDISGSQDKESKVFAELLSTLINVPIAHPNNY